MKNEYEPGGYCRQHGVRRDECGCWHIEKPECYACSKPAQPEHTPCCSSDFHGRALCCDHYCRSHFVEVDRCSPGSHRAAKQTGDN